MTAPTDVELVELALAGSEEAFRLLVVRYERPLFSLVVRMVRDPSLAEDLAQEAFVRAFRALASFDRSRKFSSWLFKIAHNLTIDHVRRRVLDTESLETPLGADGGGERTLESKLADESVLAPDRHVEQGDLASALERAIGTLRPEYREVILLRFVEGMAYQEIAEILGVPLGTVKTNIHRARKELAVLLQQGGWREA
ncbi:MAG TPA: sigma-70 family RNA polymerase sigma factor [Thermoanaerobaculia bacterium]|nr:sigma-70 family RNA polymerase sigma factor [Thermoanaerobaculia bacterium]